MNSDQGTLRWQELQGTPRLLGSGGFGSVFGPVTYRGQAVVLKVMHGRSELGKNLSDDQWRNYVGMVRRSGREWAEELSDLHGSGVAMPATPLTFLRQSCAFIPTALSFRPLRSF